MVLLLSIFVGKLWDVENHEVLYHIQNYQIIEYIKFFPSESSNTDQITYIIGLELTVYIALNVVFIFATTVNSQMGLYQIFVRSLI